MDRRVWRARAQGGYTRVYEIVEGRELSPRIAVNKKMFGEQIAEALNKAYAAGVADSAELLALQKKVERACQACGLEPERRKFAPHVTIARLGRASGEIGGWLAAHQRFASEQWTVDEFRLYESVLGAGGAHYDPVVRYPLRG